MTIDVLLAQLAGVRARGPGRWIARCPAHDDRTPSLTVAEGERGLLVRCWAGCDLDAIAGALGIATADLFYAPTRARNGKRAGETMGQTETRITTYDIRDAAGLVVAVHARHDGPRGKRFTWRRPHGATGLNGLRAADLPLYGTDIEWTDPDVRVLVEGEKAAEALWWAGIPALGTVTGASGTPGPAALEALRDRDVLLWPDNDEVGRAHMQRIADRLRGVARSVRTITWADAPAGGDAADWVERLRARGATQSDIRAAVLEEPTFATTATARPTDGQGANDGKSVESGPYRIEGGRIVREKLTKDGPVTEPLCNFTATVTEEIILDDGAETSRAFTLDGQLETGERLPTVRVPAARFSSMSWVTDTWGLRAVVRAGSATRDYLREAIQRLSPHARRRHVFTHTGWREIDGRYVYLTAGGAIGAERDVAYEVDLGADLARYCIPAVPVDPKAAMQASLRLLHVPPLAVGAVLWAGIFRAPLAHAYPLDLSLWIEGPTGSLKSTLAALYLCHFGHFDRMHLPGAWSSTANQLERRAFLLKDAPFVIDDWAPNHLDLRDLEMKAARLLRAQGNLSGRGRLRADLTERPTYHPRGLIVATGEQHPPGQSLLARTLLVELDRDAVDLRALTAAQQEADRLPHAMSGYLTWLAPQMPTLPAQLRETFAGARQEATNGGHLRVPEALAHLWLGLHCGLLYAVEIGACSPTEAEDIRHQCWSAFLELGKAQGQLVEEEKPIKRFLSVLATLLVQSKARILSRYDGETPDRGDLLGWADEEFLYLLPDGAYRAVSAFCRDAGAPFPVTADRLRRDMAKEGMAVCEEGRHTAVVRVGSQSYRVLKLRRALAEQVAGASLPVTAVTTVTGYGG